MTDEFNFEEASEADEAFASHDADEANESAVNDEAVASSESVEADVDEESADVEADVADGAAADSVADASNDAGETGETTDADDVNEADPTDAGAIAVAEFSKKLTLNPVCRTLVWKIRFSRLKFLWKKSRSIQKRVRRLLPVCVCRDMC